MLPEHEHRRPLHEHEQADDGDAAGQLEHEPVDRDSHHPEREVQEDVGRQELAEGAGAQGAQGIPAAPGLGRVEQLDGPGRRNFSPQGGSHRRWRWWRR